MQINQRDSIRRRLARDQHRARGIVVIVALDHVEAGRTALLGRAQPA
ncbi:hypothetical protein PATSB16_09290 [Pandoraea thiooxydans]|nr:hypothetical protein PATSB16_09290 [Pandoraea thiooxydans]